jgi:uncharacterized protein (DUF1697 family)
VTRYVAFLRGIAPLNPNMKNEKLREVCRDLGLENVQTIISSGNVIFDSDAPDHAELEDMIEAAWPERLGFTSTTILRTSDQIEDLATSAPFGELTHGPETYLLVTFSKHPLEVDVELPHRPPDRDYTLVGATRGELFSVTDTLNSATPDVMSWIENRFGKAVSSRTWLTVLRVRDRMRG